MDEWKELEELWQKDMKELECTFTDDFKAVLKGFQAECDELTALCDKSLQELK